MSYQVSYFFSKVLIFARTYDSVYCGLSLSLYLEFARDQNLFEIDIESYLKEETFAGRFWPFSLAIDDPSAITVNFERNIKELKSALK